MPWARLWQDIGQRVDAQKPSRVTLTIDEIRSTTGTEQNIDKPWWWGPLACDETVTGNNVRLCESGLSGQLHVANGRVTAVTFRRKR